MVYVVGRVYEDDEMGSEAMEGEKEECLCCMGRIFRAINVNVQENVHITIEGRLQIETGIALPGAGLRREESK